jgi:hypothetical protein
VCLRHASTSLRYRVGSLHSFNPDDSLQESRYSSVFHSQKGTLVPFVSRSFTLRFPSCVSLSAKQAVGISYPGISPQISLNSQHTSRVQHQSRHLCVSAK